MFLAAWPFVGVTTVEITWNWRLRCRSLLVGYPSGSPWFPSEDKAERREFCCPLNSLVLCPCKAEDKCVPVIQVLRHVVSESRDECTVEMFDLLFWLGTVINDLHRF